MIPLMMTKGYEADGWLGILLGTFLWYGFYGDTLKTDEAFLAKATELMREIGEKGKSPPPPPKRSSSMPVMDLDPGGDGGVDRDPPLDQMMRRRRKRLDTMSNEFSGWSTEKVKDWVDTQLQGSAHTHQSAVIGAAAVREGVDGVMLQKLTTSMGWEELGATALVAAKLAPKARALGGKEKTISEVVDGPEPEPEPAQ